MVRKITKPGEKTLKTYDFNDILRLESVMDLPRATRPKSWGIIKTVHLITVIEDEISSRKGYNMIEMTNPYGMKFFSGKEQKKTQPHLPSGYEKTVKQTRTNHHGKSKHLTSQDKGYSKRRITMSLSIEYSKNSYYDITPEHIYLFNFMLSTLLKIMRLNKINYDERSLLPCTYTPPWIIYHTP